MNLVARQALHAWVVSVAGDDRPPLEVDWMRARDVVFAVHEASESRQGLFLGVVGWGGVARQPARIFADLVPHPTPAPVDPQDSLERVQERFAQECVDALPVLEEGRFQGAVTRASVAEALLGGPREIDLDSQRWGRALERLRRLEERALRAERIAHDLANALMGIQQLAALTGGPSPGDLALLEQSARYGVELLGRLRALGDEDLAAVRVTTAELFPGLIQQARMLLPAGVVLETRLGEAACLRVDRTDLDRVLANLISNAREALGDAGRLALTLAPRTLAVERSDGHGARLSPGRWVVLQVDDDGHGMDEAVRELVFQPQFSTRAEQGRGLGLTTALRLVQRNGGALTCESAPGRGTRFEVWLPAVDPDADSSRSG